MINPKYLFSGLIAFMFVLGWNIFLIQRDTQMFNEYYNHIKQ